MTKLNEDIDYQYALLAEGHLDLMHLPSGAVAWLFDRPEEQVNTAGEIGKSCKDCNPVTDSNLLRSDNNVLVLHCESGHKFSVYPDGGIGCDGKPMTIEELQQVVQDMPGHEAPSNEEPYDHTPEQEKNVATLDQSADLDNDGDYGEKSGEMPSVVTFADLDF